MHSEYARDGPSTPAQMRIRGIVAGCLFPGFGPVFVVRYRYSEQGGQCDSVTVCMHQQVEGVQSGQVKVENASKAKDAVPGIMATVKDAVSKAKDTAAVFSIRVAMVSRTWQAPGMPARLVWLRQRMSRNGGEDYRGKVRRHRLVFLHGYNCPARHDAEHCMDAASSNAPFSPPINPGLECTPEVKF
jgi:hypothetical protein